MCESKREKGQRVREFREVLESVVLVVISARRRVGKSFFVFFFFWIRVSGKVESEGKV